MSLVPRLDDATRAQIRAAEPGASTWVAANAGSGKTAVLTSRVARLLLAGTEPERILCLTYTRAAAAEMQARLYQRLGTWAMLDDAALAAELDRLHETPVNPAPETLAAARQLFAKALETPGGLKIQTLHAFCDGLLRRFPLEAGVSPGFRVLDDRSAARLRDQVREGLALAAERGEDPIFDEMARLLSETSLSGLTAAIRGQRGLFPPGIPRITLARAIGADAGWTAEAACARVLAGVPPAMADALADGGGKQDAAAALALRQAARTDPAAALEGLEAAFLTAKGEARSTRGFPVKAALTRMPDLTERIATVTDRILTEREARLALAALDRAAVLHRYAAAWLGAYEAQKTALGMLDFDDLVGRARALLTTSEMAAWALWRLDGGIDHILVDEAQDTSPEQWDVITALTEEFLSGTGARQVNRTLFVVGDLKQSIYSFQGAEPRAFGAKRDWFAARLAELGPGLRDGALLHSFRSAPAILRLVDLVFTGAAAEGLGGAVTHLAFHDQRPGRVELWPFQPKPERGAVPPWWDPGLAPPADDPVARLTGTLAATIAGWLAAGRVLPGRDRALRPGDILVLVQRRDRIARGLIRALKTLGVPVSGEDRLVLTAELAVQDILATLAFVATPADDLSLAAALRSPLFGLSEDQLFDLAAGRDRGDLLWQRLRASGLAAAAVLSDLRDAADYLRPHELIERLLTRHGGRARLLARLGEEAEDGIDELLAQAIAYEAAASPSLTGFLGWIAAGDASVKREAEEAGRLLRVMTVHGAKGLEAPVVILPDTGPRKPLSHPNPVLGIGGVAVWPGPQAGNPAALRQARADEVQRAEEERRRLLYVALTRAESLLVVCGTGAEKGRETSWHGLIEAGMQAAGARVEPAPEGLDGDALILDEGWIEAAAAGPALPPAAPPALPDWAHRPPPAPEPRPVTLAPSALGGAHALPGEGEETAAARARGDLLHRLLEHLPGLDGTARGERAAALGGADLLAEVEAVLAMPQAAGIFTGLAEVPLVAPLAALGGRVLEGRIDRLVIGPDRILAVDFKSNRTVPASPDAVPDGILRQMGAYQAALEAVFPGRVVEVALVWTATARWMPLPRAPVLEALARALPIS